VTAQDAAERALSEAREQADELRETANGRSTSSWPGPATRPLRSSPTAQRDARAELDAAVSNGQRSTSAWRAPRPRTRHRQSLERHLRVQLAALEDLAGRSGRPSNAPPPPSGRTARIRRTMARTEEEEDVRPSEHGLTVRVRTTGPTNGDEGELGSVPPRAVGAAEHPHRDGSVTRDPDVRWGRRIDGACGPAADSAPRDRGGSSVIVLSLVLVIAAAVLLVLGVFQDGLLLIYLSIASCLLAMGLLGVGVLLRRRGGPVAAGCRRRRRPVGGPRSRGAPSAASPSRSTTGPIAIRPSRSAPWNARGRRRRFPGRSGVGRAGARPVSRPGVKKASSRRPRSGRSAPPLRRAPRRPAGARAGAVATRRGRPPRRRRSAVAKKATAKQATAKKATAKKGREEGHREEGHRVGVGLARVGVERVARVGEGPRPREARRALARFGDEQGLRDATVEDLTTVRGVGPALATAIKDAVEG
jgi:hypothetical protein